MANLSDAFISINNIVNNFLISYTGPGKIIPDSKRTEVVFHARRCLQEFAYETLKSQMTDDTTVPSTAGNLKDFPSDLVAIIKVTINGTEATESAGSTPAAGEYYPDYITKKVSFNAANAGETLQFDYLSNALTTDESAAIPKLAEEAMYACMVYAVLANRENTRPDVLQRLLIEKTDKLEKAKSRLVFTNF